MLRRTTHSDAKSNNLPSAVIISESPRLSWMYLRTALLLRTAGVARCIERQQRPTSRPPDLRSVWRPYDRKAAIALANVTGQLRAACHNSPPSIANHFSPRYVALALIESGGFAKLSRAGIPGVSRPRRLRRRWSARRGCRVLPLRRRPIRAATGRR